MPIRKIRVAGLLVVVAALAAALTHQPPASSSSSSPTRSRTDVPRGAPREPDVPGLTNLDPDLRDAVRRAATDAAADGVRLVVTSGWRSPEYQQRLLEQAIAKYGSEQEAARWVASPDTSAHVSGDAVDIGPSDATAWLSEHGARYGLCRIYGNEPWHYELRPQAIDQGCPPTYADPTQDPRMQR